MSVSVCLCWVLSCRPDSGGRWVYRCCVFRGVSLVLLWWGGDVARVFGGIFLCGMAMRNCLDSSGGGPKCVKVGRHVLTC